MGRDAEVFAALLARADATQLRDWSTTLLDEELQRVNATLSDALTAMQRLQETQARIETLELEQAALGIFSGRTERVMALMDGTQRLNEQLLSDIAGFLVLPPFRKKLVSAHEDEDARVIAEETISTSEEIRGVAVRNVLDLKADAKDEALVRPPVVRKTSYKETAAKLVKASLAQTQGTVEQQRVIERPDKEVSTKTKPLVPVTIIEVSDDDSEVEWTPDAEPKDAIQPQRVHITDGAEKPQESSRHEQQTDPQVTALRPPQSESLSTSAAPAVRSVESKPRQAQRQPHAPIRTEEAARWLNAKAKESTSCHSVSTKPSRKAQPAEPHASVQKPKQQKDRGQEPKDVDASFLFQAILDYEPLALPDIEAKTVAPSVDTTPSTTAKQPPATFTTQLTTINQEAVKEPKLRPWAELTQKALVGAKIGARCSLNDKHKHINSIFRPLWVLFSTIIKRPDRAICELTDGDLRRVSAAVKILNHCIAAQSLASFRLNIDSYDQFLVKMDAATKCVEKLGYSVAKYRARLKAVLDEKRRLAAADKASRQEATVIDLQESHSKPATHAPSPPESQSLTAAESDTVSPK